MKKNPGFTTRPLTAEEGLETLGDLIWTFRGAIEQGWVLSDKMLDAVPRARLAIRDGIRAGVAHELANQCAEDALRGNPSVKYFEDGGVKRFLVSGRIQIRLKKLSPALHTSQQETDAQEKHYSQGLLIEGVTSVTIGYTLAPGGETIDQVYMTCPQDYRRNHWEIQIPAEGASLPKITFDQPDLDLEGVRVTVKSKEGAGKKAK